METASHKILKGVLVIALATSLPITAGLAFCALDVSYFRAAPSVKLAIVVLFAFTLIVCGGLVGKGLSWRRQRASKAAYF
jgi:hypothetical protein